jgi:hypothetical protein
MDSFELVNCASCGTKLRVPADRGALTLRCPSCGQKFDWSPRKATARAPSPESFSPNKTGHENLRDEKWEAMVANPPLLADPVFPKDNYLQILGTALFQKVLADINAQPLIEQMRVTKADAQMVTLLAQWISFWAIDFEVTSKRGVSGRDEFLSRVKEPIRRPPPQMAAFTAEQHLLAKGVVKIQIEDEPSVPGEYQICKLRTIGWYVARLLSPPRFVPK